MDLKETIERRRSVRHFKPEGLPLDDIKEMVRLAGLAPSINNAQLWKFTAVTNKDIINNMSNIVNGKISGMLNAKEDKKGEKVKTTVSHFSTVFTDAPVVIAVQMKPYDAVVDTILAASGLSHDEMNKMRNYPDIQSIGAAIENIMLAATSMGYGCCWLTGLLVAREELEPILGVQEPYKLAACIAVGKPLESLPAREKLPLESIFEVIE
ncbi:MAG: nitroreductase family protein [Ignavibacteriales bacterium]|nr:nitroreductase family protein [Ignavibacteriales bacterium]